MSSFADRIKHFKPVRKIVYFIVGMASYPGLAIINKLKISGTEHLKNLPKEKVLFLRSRVWQSRLGVR
jgi:hypothetical protein